MKILVIGGTGLISTVTTQELAKRGDDVTVYNRGKSEAALPEGVRLIVGDRTDYPRFEQQIAETGLWDCVIDMVGYQPRDAESAVRAFRGRTDHYLFCSTVDVYQKPAQHYPIRPDAPLLGLNDYARNKVAQEKTLWEAHERGDFPVSILRPAFTYGEGRGLVHSFGGGRTYLDRLRKGKPIVVHGDGSSFWTSCHRDDVGRGFVNAAANPKTFGKSYNVAGEEWMTWDQYHQAVARGLDAPEPQLVHIPTDFLVQIAPERAGICGDNFQFNNIFDNSSAHADFGFRYTIPLEEGVRRITAWLDGHGGLPNSDDDPYDDRIIALWRRGQAQMLQDREAQHA